MFKSPSELRSGQIAVDVAVSDIETTQHLRKHPVAIGLHSQAFGPHHYTPQLLLDQTFSVAQADSVTIAETEYRTPVLFERVLEGIACHSVGLQKLDSLQEVAIVIVGLLVVGRVH